MEDWLKKDPITRFRLKLMEMGILDQESADSIEKELKNEMERAVRYAVESPYPAPEEALEDVYA